MKLLVFALTVLKMRVDMLLADASICSKVWIMVLLDVSKSYEATMETGNLHAVIQHVSKVRSSQWSDGHTTD
jgi:hypothetical protein